MVRLTDRPDMTLDVYRGRKTTIQQQQPLSLSLSLSLYVCVCVGGAVSQNRLRRELVVRSSQRCVFSLHLRTLYDEIVL